MISPWPLLGLDVLAIVLVLMFTIGLRQLPYIVFFCISDGCIDPVILYSRLPAAHLTIILIWIIEAGTVTNLVPHSFCRSDGT